MAEILVVDDVEHIRMAVKRALESQNHVVSLAENGEEAMDILKVISFDLVITDILMPQKDGIDLMRYIENSQKSHIPIIAISGGGNAATYKNILEATQKHVSTILQKPFSKDDLLDAVDAALTEGALAAADMTQG